VDVVSNSTKTIVSRQQWLIDRMFAALPNIAHGNS